MAQDPEYNRAWQQRNREHLRAYKRRWRAANPEKVAESYRKWRLANRELVNAYSRASKRRRRYPFWSIEPEVSIPYGW